MRLDMTIRSSLEVIQRTVQFFRLLHGVALNLSQESSSANRKWDSVKCIWRQVCKKKVRWKARHMYRTLAGANLRGIYSKA